jgi:hypothetical protein
MRLRNVLGAVALAALLTLAGCGDPAMPTVSGTIKVDGQPVEEGAIRFTPADGMTQTTGGEIKNGKYSVRVPVGTMKVSISAPKVVGKKKIYNTPNSPVMPITVEAIPARYNEKTELTLEVKGATQKDWDLQGK